jgi:hypothetical protein
MLAQSGNAEAHPSRARKCRSKEFQIELRLMPDLRALAWEKAKEANYAHQHYVAELLRSDLVFSERLATKCFGQQMGTPRCVRAKGKHAKRVPGILGSKTTSKVNIYVEWSSC